MFPKEIVHIIAEYAAEWTIVPWIQEIEANLLDSAFLYGLSRADLRLKLLTGNPRSEDILRKYPIGIADLSCNDSDWALDILEKHIDLIDPGLFSCNSNPRAIKLLKVHSDKIYWNWLSRNHAAIEILKESPENVNYRQLQANSSIEAKYMLDEAKTIIDPVHIESNHAPWAIELMKAWRVDFNAGLNYWYNTHPWVVEQFINGGERGLYDWSVLSSNKSAMHILRSNKTQITMDIYANPEIFEPTIRPGIENILMNC